jgi:tRNA1Val (adenine37-N6)-methyltransferase
MKVTTDACLFGGWLSKEVESEKLKVESALDIGTGTGLLALMLAQKVNAEIDCVEIDADAAKQAQENVDASPWKERIFILQGDAKKMVHTLNKKYDVIISNPPFYEKEIKSGTESKNVAHHSKDLTLDELLRLIKEYLNPKGSFYLLLPYKRNEEIKKLFRDHEFHISKLLLVRQSVKHDYFRIMIKGELKEQEKDATEFDELSIWNEHQQYAPEFTSLLKDYYLYL